MTKPERDAKDDASKASFKLDLIETVNADPKVKQPSDLKLLAAYCSVMGWPKRRAWLSTSRARAMTGLAESQVSTSRKRLQEQGYLKEDGTERGTKAFILENPRRDDIRQHIAITTEHLRDKQAERQATRRAHWRAVSANFGDTAGPMSHLLGECDVSPNSDGNIPSYTPQDIALKEGPLPKGNSYASGSGDDPHIPFPAPTSEEEMTLMLSHMFEGHQLEAHFLSYFRKRLMDGKLTPADIQEHWRHVG
jgi:hypothetical protein